MLEVKNLHCGYGKKQHVEIVHGVSLSAGINEVVCIIGANGCGKTTLLKAMMGLLPATEGEINIQGKNIARMREAERARRFAYIPQAHIPPFPFSVADVVLLGRTPYINRLAQITEHDRVVAYRALELLGIIDLAEQAYTKLSGGQQQLILIARALTQEADILIMDEPTASLDFGNQQLVLSRIKALARMGKAVIMVTHDPDHALFCADRVAVMDKGEIIKDDTPAACINTEMLGRIYNADVLVMDVAVELGRTERVCIPLSKAPGKG